MTDITKMNVTDLKALAYDVVSNVQKLQQDLIILNQEIVNKSQRVQKEIVDDAKIDVKE